MNSQQEKVLFRDWGWEYDFIGRSWVAPDGTKLSLDELLEITADSDGELALMRLIVECGIRTV